MTTTTIIDLDELLPADKLVSLKGQRYTLPGDLPVELYLRITRGARDGIEGDEAVKALYDEILGLFREHHPDLASLPLGLNQMVGVIAKVYGDQTEEPAAIPPPRRRSGTAAKTGNSRPTKRSRSST